jgi:hypothetical protein
MNQAARHIPPLNNIVPYPKKPGASPCFPLRSTTVVVVDDAPSMFRQRTGPMFLEVVWG